MSSNNGVRLRWTQARRILRWRVPDPEDRREALAALHRRHPCAPQCLAVITAVGGQTCSAFVAMGKSHWSLLNSADAAVDEAGCCVLTIHDLDETEIESGMLTLLAFDEAGEIVRLPPGNAWHSSEAALRSRGRVQGDGG